MKSLYRRAGLVVITLFIVPLLSAATYIVPDDETFIRRAELIVSGTVLDSWSQFDANGRIETIYRLAVDEVLKGEAGEILELREWGGVVGDRWMATSAGVHYETGKRYVVFGKQLPDARWTTLDFGLGQFSFVRRQDAEFIVRNQSEIFGWDREGRIHREHPRETQRFLQKIRSLSSLSPASTGGDPTPVSEVNNLDHATAAATGASQWSGGSVVNYSVSGTPASGNTMNEQDGQDRIIIDDPENLIPGTFTGSGTLAIAFFGGQVLSDRLNITGSDIVVQNGVEIIGQNSYNSMMTHEMGHTLGFRHSNQNEYSENNTSCDPAALPCSGSAIMNASVVPGLNGNLQAWDFEAQATNYGTSTSFDAKYLIKERGFEISWHRGSPVTTWFIAAPQVSTCTGPTITAQPTAQPSTINSGQSSQLSVSATASEGLLSYQWFQGTSGTGAQIFGATSASISVSPTATQNYWVRVTAQCNNQTVNSNTVTVTVQAGCQGPTITQQPTATPSLINAGQSSQLSVAATASEGSLSYQWFRGNSGNTANPIGTGSSISVSPTTTTNYWVRVTDQCNGSTSVNSNTVTVTVCEPAFLISEPLDTSVESGSSTTLSVTAGGTATLNYQWYRGTSGDTSTPVGTNSRFFTTPNLTQQTTYWVRVSNSCGQANSRTVTVSVTAACEPPQITQQPQSVTIGTGTTATLTVQATGTALSYQWFEVQGSTQTAISGATGPTLVTAALTATKTYFVRVSNSCGQLNSAQATVTVTTCAPPAITNQPAGTKIVATQSAFLFVSTSGTEPLTFQWYAGQTGDTSRPVAGATGSSLTTGPLRETTRYWVRVTNACGSVNSATATVEVEPARRRPVGRRG